MPIDRDDVLRVAELARLEVAENEIVRLAEQLSQVLDFAAALHRLDLAGKEPTRFAPGDAPLREDVPDSRRLSQEQALAAAPESEDGFFLVPPIVENVNP